MGAVLAHSHVLWSFEGLSNGNDCCLRSKNGWHKISTSDVSDTAHRESTSFEIIHRQLIVIYSCNKIPQVAVDIQYALILNFFDDGSGQPELRVDGNGEIVVMFDHIFVDVPVRVEFWVNYRINNGVVVHRQRNGFDEEGQDSKAFDILL